MVHLNRRYPEPDDPEHADVETTLVVRRLAGGQAELWISTLLGPGGIPAIERRRREFRLRVDVASGVTADEVADAVMQAMLSPGWWPLRQTETGWTLRPRRDAPQPGWLCRPRDTDFFDRVDQALADGDALIVPCARVCHADLALVPMILPELGNRPVYHVIVTR